MKKFHKFIKDLDIKETQFGSSILDDKDSIEFPSKHVIIFYCELNKNSETLGGRERDYHYKRYIKCKEHGFHLITMFEDEWLNNTKIIQSKIRHILGLNDEKSIYARKCYITSIEPNTASVFCKKYHIQGYAPSSIKLGAYHMGNLVAIMTFNVPSLSKGNKYNKGDVYELSRFCTSSIVVGIAGKFMKYFQNNYRWSKIFTFADIRWSNGNLYRKIGFDNGSERITKPNYYYYKPPSIKRYHRFNFRKDVLNNKLNMFDNNKTEYENMVMNGYSRIWDAGNYRWEITNEDYKSEVNKINDLGLWFE